MIVSDGLTREQFMPLWRDAMWECHSLHDRARLVLELGRLDVREQSDRLPTRLVAHVDGLDAPFVLLQLTEPPTAQHPQERQALILRLAEMGASEVFVMMTLRGGGFGGIQNYLLSVWAESRHEEPACWVMPFRWAKGGLQEAAPLAPPNPGETEIGKRLGGLVRPRH